MSLGRIAETTDSFGFEVPGPSKYPKQWRLSQHDGPMGHCFRYFEVQVRG